ncbi:hypothetical protein EJ08DRAFT_340921 [Tothia fuscella]|uniref:RRM domain-containing protein n=1 Tax=Tothia fuscella TaxID=1048955 RepID=A0A9P4P1F1_9PEZI|nr:hypothetical protein EJ08DRAFT_340921 [Tothia fuscella]
MSHSEDRSYFLTVELLPVHLKDWAAFKDLIRSYLPSNQPGWTVVDPAENGYWVGTFTVKTKSDSEIVYQKLVRYSEKSTRLLVHRFDTSMNPPPLLECNCQAIYGVPHMYQSRSQAQVQRCMTMPSQSQYYSYPSAPVAPAPAIAHYDWNQQAQVQGLTSGFQSLAVAPPAYSGGYYAASVDRAYVEQQQYATGPTYVRNTYGLPVNVSHGAVATECREVHISHIHYQLKKRELIAKLDKIVAPSKIEMDFLVDHAGKFKGTAVATFDSSDAATKVVAKLDKTSIKGKKVRVRLGKQQTPVSPSPVIVNGSTF